MKTFRPFALSIEERRNARAYLNGTWTREYQRARRGMRIGICIAAGIVGLVLLVIYMIGRHGR